MGGKRMIQVWPEDALCLECGFEDCRFACDQTAREHARMHGEAPCAYWAAHWARTGWVYEGAQGEREVEGTRG